MQSESRGDPPEVADDRSPDDAGVCTMAADLSVLCPATYAAAEDLACHSTCADTSASCADFLVLISSRGFEWNQCYYDTTSRTLVGMFHCTDYNAYCGGTAYCFAAGAPLGMCARQFRGSDQRPLACPDGGAGDGGMSAPDGGYPDAGGCD